MASAYRVKRWNISIHAPRTGSDAALSAAAFSDSRFQSTLPARGATVFMKESLRKLMDFNPRSPHGERLDILRVRNRRPDNFNPRSPHGERPGWGASAGLQCLFQSTLPARGATGQVVPCG